MSWPLSFQHVQPANRVLLEDQDQFKRGFNMSYIANKRLATCAVISAFLFVQVVSGQNSPEPAVPAPNEPAKLLSGQQLDNLVAPIALYPDPLLGEVLAASTYPFEIAEAQQWVQDHPKWKPSKLMNEAKKQNWDPSIQGLVAFPQVLALLSQGVSWTTSLGNAFLAQQSDVMQAVQRLRAQAQAAGKLQSTPQETVTTENRLGQSAVRIEPANPDIWYVPNYNPAYVWGPPIYGYYPPLFYPGIDIGFGWGPGIDLDLYFGGWGGWGWGGGGWSPNWYGGSIILNHSFFHRYGFNHFHGEPLGTSSWAHDPAHRLGVPYANREVAGRFAGREGRGEASFNPRGGFDRGSVFGHEGFGSSGFEQRSYADAHSVFGGYHDGGATRIQSDHGFSSMGGFGGGGFRGGGIGGGGFHGGGFHGGGGRR
jgi:hypothetical protein